MDRNSSGQQNTLDLLGGGLLGGLGGPGAMAGGLTGALAGHSLGGGQPPAPTPSPGGTGGLPDALSAINAMPGGAGAAAKAGGMGAMMSKASPYLEAARVLGELLKKQPPQVVSGGGAVTPQ